MALIGRSDYKDNSKIYTKIYGIEIDKKPGRSKKYIIRTISYDSKLLKTKVSTDEYCVNIEKVKPSLKIIAEKAIDIKKINKALKPLYKDKPVTAYKKHRQNEYSKCVANKLNELAIDEMNDIWNKVNLNVNIYKTSYSFLKKHIDIYKRSGDG